MPARSQTDLVVSPRVIVPAAELEWSFARSSGPGGQNVNKVNSKTVLRWNPIASTALPLPVRERFLARYAARLTETGELVIASDERRDQPQNVECCLDKLRELIQSVLVAPRPRKPTKPSKGAHRRRLAAKQQHSQKKQSRAKPRTDD